MPIPYITPASMLFSKVLSFCLLNSYIPKKINTIKLVKTIKIGIDARSTIIFFFFLIYIYILNKKKNIQSLLYLNV
jgi:hypothetical protein